MQSIMPTSFQHDGTLYNGYVYIGENGEEIYFKESSEKECCDSNTQCYPLFEDIDGHEMKYDPWISTIKY